LSRIPVLEGTYSLAKAGVIPGGSKANHTWLEKDIHYEEISTEEQIVLCDAITSGGLLVAMPEAEANQYVEDLHAMGMSHAAIIGTVTDKNEKLIYVKK
ncbi:MAG: AIR synthase-related protein, partial [Bacillota bacterium]|nr:AIR synthase-related protein [Bacillota bacterium]